MHARSLALIGLTALAACAGPDEALDARSSQIELFLARSLLPLARSRPHQLTLRLDAMSASPFRFLRGTEALYTRDLRDPALPFARTGLPSVERVLLQGDAHPENAGTFAGPRVDLNDFDAAGFGPPWWEVRRAGAALLVALREVNPSLDGAALARRLGASYARTVVAGDAAALGPADVGVVMQKRLSSAAKDGAARSELADFTTQVGGQRRLRRGGTDAADPREALLAAPPAVLDALGPALERYRATLQRDPFPPGYFALKDAARRCGQGVGSLSAVRFYALIEGESASPDDDVILQLKEATDASLDADLAQGARGPSPAQRVVERQRRLQSIPDADPRLGHTRLLDLPIVVSTVTGLQKTVRVDDLAGSLDDIQRFADDMGALLGRSHLRGVTIHNEPALPLLGAWLTGLEDAFADETAAAATAYAAQAIADHQRFLALRARLGASLGLTTPTPSDVPRDDPARALLDPPCP